MYVCVSSPVGLPSHTSPPFLTSVSINTDCLNVCSMLHSILDFKINLVQTVLISAIGEVGNSCSFCDHQSKSACDRDDESDLNWNRVRI